MSGFGAVFSRELRSLVATPLAWGAAAAVAIPAGMGFAFDGLASGSVADLASAVGISLWCAGAAACALGARSVPSERAAGTWDLTLASGVDVTTVLLAKYSAISLAGAALIAPIVLQAVVLSTVASPAWSVILCGALGVWLIMAALAGIGLLAGVLARSNAGAIVAALTGAAAWIALCRGGQSMQWPAVASAAFALDPIRRAEDFTRGGLDLGGAISLLAMGFAGAWCAGAMARGRARTTVKRGVLSHFLLCAGVLFAVVSTVLSARGPGAPEARVESATLWSGSLQAATREFISRIRGPMSVTLLSAMGNSDAGALRNARAVLARADGATLADGASLHCQEGDLLDVSDAEKIAAIFEQIQNSESSDAGAWQKANEGALLAHRSIEGFAEESIPRIQKLVDALGQTDPARGKLEAFASAMIKTASQGQSVRDSISLMAKPTVDRPLGNPEGAGRRLASELRWWSGALVEIADLSGNKLKNLPPEAATTARDLQRSCAQLAEKAMRALDRIDQLPPLRLSEVAAAMQHPPTLIVSGSKGVSAIPAWQMRASVDATELALVEAIRCAEGAPRVCATIVHSQTSSPLESVPGGGDLSHVVQSLRAARIEVDQWNPSKATRPLSQGAKRVWIAIPPMDRPSREPDAAELAMLEAIRQLVSEGEPLLVAVAANPFASMGISDPWADLFQFAGLRARSGQVVLDLAARSENSKELRSFVELTGSDQGHGAGVPAANEKIVWPMPLPIEISNKESWTATAIEIVPPAPGRWIENDPRVVSRSMEAAPEGKVFTQGVPVLVVAERDDGVRLAISGGQSWLHTLHCGMGDASARSLRFPGNRDLIVGLVRWLAGGDSIPTLADTCRVPQLSERARAVLGAIGLAGIPGSLALAGGILWGIRKRR